MKKLLWALHKDESGQGLVEYVLIIALIAFAAVAGMSTLASSLNSAFTQGRHQAWQLHLLVPDGARGRVLRTAFLERGEPPEPRTEKPGQKRINLLPVCPPKFSTLC